MPRRLDFVRFCIGDDEVEVAFMVALELAGRCEPAADEEARSFWAAPRTGVPSE
jgi:hypothetical protein